MPEHFGYLIDPRIRNIVDLVILRLFAFEHQPACKIVLVVHGMADSTTSTLRAEPGTTRKSRDLDVQSGTSKGKTGDDEAALVGDEVADTSLGISPDSDDKEASLEKGIPLSPVKEEAPSFPVGTCNCVWSQRGILIVNCYCRTEDMDGTCAARQCSSSETC